MEAIVKSINELDFKESYTYADYLLWQFKERVELFRGRIFKMSPAPSSFHQEISGNLYFELRSLMNDSSCKLFTAPFDVRLLQNKDKCNDNQISTVVQPDLCIICDKTKIDEKGCLGAPNLIIEILSPGNSKKEMDIKYDLYEENGVTEYWIVSPESKTISIFVLKDAKYIGMKPILIDSVLQSPTFPNLKISVKKIFNT